MDKQDVN